MPEGALSDGLILAALDRAERHQERTEPGVLYAVVVEHLGLQRGSATGRRLRPRFRELEAAGLLEGFKRNGGVVWTLTPKGRKRLASVAPVSLPESPQHCAWREARAATGERIGDFREELRAALDEATFLLSDEEAASEPWFVLGERLQRACLRLGSATHCLYEWAEPDDAC